MAVDRSYVGENQAQLTRLQALVDRLSDRDLAHPMDAGWTVAGVLAHLAFWDQRIVVLLDRWGADGGGTPPTGFDEGSVELMRERFGLPVTVLTGPATDNEVGNDYIKASLGVPAFNARKQAEGLVGVALEAIRAWQPGRTVAA